MEFLTLLDLAIDFDAKSLKKAYRLKLKQHHPEDDPEGFKQVREAYEQALAHLASREATDSTVNQVLPPVAETVTEQTADDTSVIDNPYCPLEVLEHFRALLSCSSILFREDKLDAWLYKVQQLSIVDFNLLNDHVINEVLTNLWLPPSFVDKLWHAFDWSMLLDNGEENNRIGQYLLSWSQRASYIDLSELATLGQAEQKNWLSTNHSLALGLENNDINGLSKWLTQATTLPPLNKRLCLAICQALAASPINKPEMVSSLVHYTLGRFSHSLSTEERFSLAHLALMYGDDQLAQVLGQSLLSENAYPEFCYLQYLSHKHTHPDLALLYGFLSKQMWPKPKSFWFAETSSLALDTKSPLRQRWLRDQLTEFDSEHFQAPVSFIGKTNPYDLLCKKLWLGLNGSYRAISQSLKSECASDDPQLIQLSTIIDVWLTEQLNSHQLPASVLTLLDKYGEPGWFNNNELTEKHLDALSQKQWLDCISRHPLLPDQWCRLLIEKGVLNKNSAERFQFSNPSLYRCLFGRVVDPEFQITSAWNHADIDFQWAEFFYAYNALEKPDLAGCIPYLPPLDDNLRGSPLAALVSYVQQDGYYPNMLNGIANYPEQFTFYYVTINQIDWLVENLDESELIGLAMQKDYYACLALSQLWQHEHLDEAIVLWNLVATRGYRQRSNLKVAVNWQRDALAQEVEQQGLYKEEFRFTEPDALRAYLTLNREWFTPVNDLVGIDPTDEAKSFHFPMCVLLSHLHQGISQDGEDIEPLKALFRRREVQTPTQKVTSDIALLALEDMYQEKLDAELSQGKAKVTSSKLYAFWSFVASFVAIIAVGVVAKFAEIDISGKVYLPMMIASIAVTFRTIAKGLPITVNKRRIYFYPAFLLILAIIFKDKIIFFCFLFAIFYSCISMSPLYTRGGWARKIVKSKRVDLRKILS